MNWDLVASIVVALIIFELIGIVVAWLEPRLRRRR